MSRSARAERGPAGTPAPILADPNRGLSRAALHAFYDAVWWLAIVLGSPWWLTRAALDPAFRAMARARLARDLPPAPAAGARRRVLIHGVSVGEVKATASLVRLLEAEHPELEVVVSATTDTGMEMARLLYPELLVVRFPLDPARVVEHFLDRLKPACVVLMELEIWPNFLRAANRRGVPVAVVNGRITERSHGRYELFRHLLPQFNRITLFCVQVEAYAARFATLVGGRERILVTGNVKADELGDAAAAGPEDAALERLVAPTPGQLVLCAGSTHEPEEGWLVEAWRRAAPDARLVLVPRHPRRAAEAVAAAEAAGAAPQRLSALRAGEAPDPTRPLLVDTIGELVAIYGLADVVFVGGSLIEHGGHNMLEPAARGCAVLYGPHVHNFVAEADLLESLGGGRRVEGRAELEVALRELAADAELRARMGRAGREAVERQRGATRRTLAALEERCGLG